MLLHSAENLKIRPDYGEVVDIWGNPLCIMRHADISQQHLMHRSCTLLMIDKTGHMVLKKKKDGWCVSSHAQLQAWQSDEACAHSLLSHDWGVEARLVYKGSCLPCPENCNSHTSVFHAMTASLAHMAPLLDMEHHLVISKAEISMLSRLEKFFSPLLSVLFSKGLI